MRNYKFRGRSLITGEWVYGHYYNMDDNRKGNRRHIIVYESHNAGLQTIHEPVEPETIGLYTGLKDENGMEIYEGDIVINTGLWFLHSKQFYGNPSGIGYGKGEKMIVVKNITGFELRCIKDFLCHKDEGFPPNGYFHKPYVDNYTFWNLQRTLKIIGNVYENQKLLEVD